MNEIVPNFKFLGFFTQFWPAHSHDGHFNSNAGAGPVRREFQPCCGSLSLIDRPAAAAE